MENDLKKFFGDEFDNELAPPSSEDEKVDLDELAEESEPPAKKQRKEPFFEFQKVAAQRRKSDKKAKDGFLPEEYQAMFEEMVQRVFTDDANKFAILASLRDHFRVGGPRFMAYVAKQPAFFAIFVDWFKEKPDMALRTRIFELFKFMFLDEPVMGKMTPEVLQTGIGKPVKYFSLHGKDSFINQRTCMELTRTWLLCLGETDFRVAVSELEERDSDEDKARKRDNAARKSAGLSSHQVVVPTPAGQLVTKPPARAQIPKPMELKFKVRPKSQYSGIELKKKKRAPPSDPSKMTARERIMRKLAQGKRKRS